MMTNLKSLEELMREIPPEREAEVRTFVEAILAQEGATQTHTQTGARTFEDYFGAWDSGDENSADNERIDADLAREYEATHEPNN
jgi:hypothetical protein